MPTCANQCGRSAKSARSKFCLVCFRDQASQSGARSAGNTSGNPENKGNAEAKGKRGNKGNAEGNPGNKGNAEAKGKRENKGNVKKGEVKKKAGVRSGVKRSAKVALVVKKRWLDLILAGAKDWEIRGKSTTRRGWIHFAESQAGGKLVGRARLVDCVPVTRAAFDSHFERHHVPSRSMVSYESIFAWVLEDAERFKQPFVYKHLLGAVIWIKV